MLGFNLLCLRRRRKAWTPPSAKNHPPPPPRIRTHNAPRKNGAGRQMAPTPPLPVTEDTPPDMLAGSMDLRVVLPSGHSVKMSVERGTPMMDLLVQVATANKIPPGGHVIQAVGERGLLPYKPSTPIGALDTWTIQIVPKSRVFPATAQKKAPLKPSNQQPFEQTFRLQVHLPRNQLFVARVSPKTLLSDVLSLACSEKNLDPSKYELRHPANLEERLRPDWTLADYKLQEVTMVAKGGRPLGAGLSSSDIMALQKEEEKRRQQTRAGGTGSAVLGLMYNKRSRSSVCDGSISSDSLGGRSISPVHSDGTPSPPGSSLPPPRPARKRRPAPKPPVAPAAVISHSRNSSDSSGYHEASVLSESPESNGLSSPSGTLPRRSKLTSAAPAPPPSSSLSRSLSNLTSVSSAGSKVAPRGDGMRSCLHSVSTSSLASSGHGKKKKAAPPPPPTATTLPKATKQIQPQRTVTQSTISSQSSMESYDSINSAALDRDATKPAALAKKEVVVKEIPKEQIVVDVHAQEIPKQSPLESGGQESALKPVQEKSPASFKEQGDVSKKKSVEKQTKDVKEKENSVPLKASVPESKLQTAKPPQEEETPSSSKPVPLSPKVELKQNEPKPSTVEEIPKSKAQPSAESVSSTVEPIKASLPDVVSDLQSETEELERAFQSVTDELEAAILADELKKASPLPEPPSPLAESQSPSLSDWEYQLPAPPSAFRDQHSPTPTQGETIVLAETRVFDDTASLQVSETLDQSPGLSILEQQSLSDQSSTTCILPKRLGENRTKMNPLFNAQQFEEDMSAQQQNEAKQRLSDEITASHSSVKLEEEEDWEPQQFRLEMKLEDESTNHCNYRFNKSSFNNDSNQSQLKNFRITTYHRPTISTVQDESGSVKKPQPSVHLWQKGTTGPVSTLPRTNSFNANNEYPDHTTVKRSTSHISLVNTGHNFRAKSVGNITWAAAQENRKTFESEGRVENRSEPQHKTNSETNATQGQAESKSSGQSSTSSPESSVQPLQSLQVIKNILNPSGPEQSQLTSQKEENPNRTATEQTTQGTGNMPQKTTSRIEHNPDVTNSDTVKRYTYKGPPAVNFSTWSERPKSQVSIKVDSDYRIGKGQNACASGSNQEFSVLTEMRERLSNGSEEVDSNARNDTTSKSDDKHNTPSQATKIEPAPLAMRIVSHNTLSSYKRPPPFSNTKPTFTSKLEEGTLTSKESLNPLHQKATRTNSYNTAQVADPSRVPIVRAVELKKTFIQGQQQGSSTGVQLNWNEVDNSHKRIGSVDINATFEREAPSAFQGVNNLAKRFSVAAPSTESVRAGFRGQSARPVSAYLYNGPTDSIETVNMKRNSTSTSALNNIGANDYCESSNANSNTTTNLNSARKYTSVVGINGAGTSTTNVREEVNRINPKITNASSIKVNGFAAPKQPMPVVKGFRFASNGANHSDASLVAGNTYKSTGNAEPLTVKVQRSDSYVNQNQRRSTEHTPTFNVRIQHMPPTKVDSSAVKSNEPAIPIPPPLAPIPYKKPSISRPKSFAAPEPSPRDQLMDAIRSFGGRSNLKQTGGSTKESCTT